MSEFRNSKGWTRILTNEITNDMSDNERRKFEKQTRKIMRNTHIWTSKELFDEREAAARKEYLKKKVATAV